MCILQKISHYTHSIELYRLDMHFKNCIFCLTEAGLISDYFKVVCSLILKIISDRYMLYILLITIISFLSVFFLK